MTDDTYEEPQTWYHRGVHTFEHAIREVTSSADVITDATPELLAAMFIMAWRNYRTDAVIGIDELEVGLSLANGSPEAELTDDRTVGEQALNDVVHGPEPKPKPNKNQGLFRMSSGDNPGLFRSN